jgi:benzoyl-CoA reductase subunit D
MITSGIDVGTSSVKFALMNEGREMLATRTEKIRKRDPKKVVDLGYSLLLEEAQIARQDVGYVATTGEGESIPFATGHFYGMTTHARGGLFLDPEARGALDLGALHCRAMLMDERGKVLQYRMTSQCASGSGQFLENISRYLGITLDEISSLSLQSTRPETCSSICAVLAETDVINMVSRGIQTMDILKGIHLSMAGRLVKLLQACKARGKIILTGGLSGDEGLRAALEEVSEQTKQQALPFTFRTHPEGIYAGALGAAIWGHFRYFKLLEKLGA